MEEDSTKFAACKGFEEASFFRDVHRGFIAAGYGNGGVGLPSLSSSFSIPELLSLVSPGPTLWPYPYSPQYLEGYSQNFAITEISEVD